MNKVILSFDYEIYFDGKNDYQTLITNTSSILSIAKMHSIKCVFFVDSYYLIQLKHFKLDEAYEAIVNQIKQIQEAGHEVQYHFHPHWVNAIFVYDKLEWQFDKSEYSYSDLVNKYGTQKANDAFEKGLNILEAICANKSIAFRAGGLSVQGAESAFIDVLKQHHFKFDSSVLPQLTINAKYLTIDYRTSPLNDQWYIQESFLKASNEKTELIEIPLMMLDHYKRAFLPRVWTSLKYRFLKSIEIKRKSKYITGKPMDLQIHSFNYPDSITFDLSRGADIIIMRRYTLQFFKQQRQLLCMIAHPKSMDKSAQKTMNRYCQWLNKQSYNVIGFSDLN